MIFVTVGTHEQPFNRLVEYVDQLKKKKLSKKRFLSRVDILRTNLNIANFQS